MLHDKRAWLNLRRSFKEEGNDPSRHEAAVRYSAVISMYPNQYLTTSFYNIFVQYWRL